MAGRKGGRRLRDMGDGAALFPLGVLFTLQLLDQATQSAFGVLIPNVRDAFHLSDASILAIVAVASAASLLATVPIAWLADRTARVRIAATSDPASGSVTAMAQTASPLIAGAR